MKKLPPERRATRDWRRSQYLCTRELSTLGVQRLIEHAEGWEEVYVYRPGNGHMLEASRAYMGPEDLIVMLPRQDRLTSMAVLKDLLGREMAKADAIMEANYDAEWRKRVLARGWTRRRPRPARAVDCSHLSGDGGRSFPG